MASNSTEAETKVKLELFKSNMTIAVMRSGFQNYKLRKRYTMDSALN